MKQKLTESNIIFAVYCTKHSLQYVGFSLWAGNNHFYAMEDDEPSISHC